MGARRLLEGAPTWRARMNGEGEYLAALMLVFDGAAFLLLRTVEGASDEQEFATREDLDAGAQAARDELSALGWVWEQV
jgi:hypothetical protein